MIFKTSCLLDETNMDYMGFTFKKGQRIMNELNQQILDCSKFNLGFILEIRKEAGKKLTVLFQFSKEYSLNKLATIKKVFKGKEVKLQEGNYEVFYQLITPSK